VQHLIIGLAGYALMLYFLIRVFRSNSNMLHVNTLWQALVVILGSLVAYFMLGDRLTHPVQYIGILFAILAVFCINYS